MESLVDALFYLMAILGVILFSIVWVLLISVVAAIVAIICIIIGVGLKKLWQARK